MALVLLPESYRAWDHFMDTLRNGTSGHEIAHGGTLWDSMRRDPDFAKRFNRAMVTGTEQVAEFVAANFDFASASTIVDVGGGNGALAAGVLQAHPHLQAIISDLAPGLAGTEAYLARKGVLSRSTIVESDFFNSVPQGDVYLLKEIIHDWDDKNAARILAACRRATVSSGRIVLVERMLPARVTATPSHLNAVMTDLQMMVQLGSQERTVGEYRDLLEAANFRFVGVIPGALYSIAQGVAA
ncbi:MAG: methyltransferase [Candidatus Dormibacteraceae bacterium]